MAVRRDVRMVNVFGHREQEIAAIRILDQQWERPFQPVSISGWSADELDGLQELKENGWIHNDGSPTRAFWERVHGR